MMHHGMCGSRLSNLLSSNLDTAVLLSRALFSERDKSALFVDVSVMLSSRVADLVEVS